MSWFKTKKNAVIGIDITTTSVRAAEMTIEGNHPPRLTAYAMKSLPANAVEGHVIKDTAVVGSSIRQLLHEGAFHHQQAVLAVPDSAAISHHLQVHDTFSNADIEDWIHMEAEKYIPFPIEEVHLDFEVLGPSKTQAGMLDVLLVGSRSENVNTRVEAALNAELDVVAVEVGSFAIERLLQLTMPEALLTDKIVACVDVDEISTQLIVLQGNTLIYARDEEFGSQVLLDEIVRHYGLTQVEAIRLKSSTKPPSDYQEIVIAPYVDHFLASVKRALQFFFSSTQYSKVDNLWLAGDLGAMGDITGIVQRKLNIPTKLYEWERFLKPTSNILLVHQYDSMPSLVACGLALRPMG